MAASAWICPSCDRRVPRTVDVCRCGHEWTGAEEAVADPPRETPAAGPVQGPRKLPTAAAGGAIVFIAAVIAFIAMGRPGRPVTPSQPAATEVSQPLEAAPAHPAEP